VRAACWPCADQGVQRAVLGGRWMEVGVGAGNGVRKAALPERCRACVKAFLHPGSCRDTFLWKPEVGGCARAQESLGTVWMSR
jgi:hypothetical protein